MSGVVIVGAGPAGLTTARKICELSNKEVVVLEKSSETGKPLQCAGGLSYDRLKKEEIHVPERLIEQRIRKLTIQSKLNLSILTWQILTGKTLSLCNR